ncbi:MAG: TonB-dependent receptor plug domain-containing protein, partial [Gammaproteobacteria bacterium]|nr:TonB-dependent receptor plug domain-containing protein [Gammaproteobacteria bacterium]
MTSAAWAASDSSQLPVMVVSATGYQQEVLRAPASITVVEHDQIQRKPVADLAEVLRDIPGVDIVDSGVAGMKRISLRGESSRRVLIKVNGQPLPDHSSYGSPLLLDANTIERIEVVRGSASVVHGSNAIGGVVNITTRQAAPGEQEAFIGAGYYSATHGQRLNGGVLGATDRFDWRLQLSKADFGDRRIPRGQVKGSTDQTKYSRLKPSDSEQKSVSAELGWRLDERQRI